MSRIFQKSHFIDKIKDLTQYIGYALCPVNKGKTDIRHLEKWELFWLNVLILRGVIIDFRLRMDAVYFVHPKFKIRHLYN